MAASVNPPLLTPMPPAPLPTDSEAVFDAKAGASLVAQDNLVDEQNVALQWQAEAMADTKAARDAAAGSATAAAGSATTAAAQVGLAANQVQLATEQVNLAGQAKQGAEAARDQAVIAAGAAGAAAGLPSFAGQKGKALVVKQNETGVEYKAIAQAVGDYLVSLTNPGSTYTEGGRVSYLQSAYPALFALVGLLPDSDRSVITSVSVRPSGESGGQVTIAESSTLMVSVNGAGAYCYTSIDRGETWTKRTFPYTGSVYSVCYNPVAGLFLATTYSGPVYTSPDGIAWTARAFSYGNNAWVGSSVAGLFVVMPSYGAVANTLYTSPDGITWATRTVNFGAVDTITKLNNQLAVWSASGAGIYYTSDGITWNYASLPSCYGIAYSKGNYFATRGGDMSTLRTAPSLAGPWTTIPITFTFPGGTTWMQGGCMFSPDKGVIVFTTTGTSYALVSNDAGSTWQQRTIPSAFINIYNQSFDNGKRFILQSGISQFALPLYSYDSALLFITPPVITQAGLAKTYIKGKAE